MKAPALRALVLLALVAASLVLFAHDLSSPGLPEFVKTNGVALSVRLRLVAFMAAGSVAAALAGAFYYWCWGEERLRRTAHRLAPLAVLGMLPSLCVPDAWSDTQHAAIAIGGFVLLTERTLRLSFAAATHAERPWFDRVRALRVWQSAVVSKAKPWVPLAAVLLSTVGYAVYMSVHTLWMHGRFQTYGYDLGQYDNVFWSTLHGHPLWDAPMGWTENWSELQGHADLSTFFLLPFYAIKPGGAALLVIQSCVLALGAIPLYRFGARHLPRSLACLIAIAYLFYPPMHGLQFYDFHFQPIASTFVLFVIDFVDARRYVPCAIAFLVALGCREDVPIGLAILGVFLVLSGYRRLPGLVMSIVAMVYFVVIRFVIMPRIGPTWFHDIYKDLIPSGAHSFAGVIATLLSNPAYVFSTMLTGDKLRYALQILVPVAFLPLRRPYLAVSLAHGSLLTLLTTQYAATIDLGFQYSANFIPYIFPASVLAIKELGGAPDGRSRQRAALSAILIGTALCGIFWGAIPPRKSIKGGFVTMAMTRPTEVDRKKHRDLVELHGLVPADAWLAVSEQEMPHISRLKMRSLRDTTDADYILYGVGSIGSANGDRVLAAGQFEKIAERPGLLLLKRK
jgi:uncharacterized membrane protein